MAEIIDLDDVLPPNKKVRIGGQVYELPGDIPTELFLRIQRATGTIAEDEDGIGNLYEAIKELFLQTNSKEKVDKLQVTLTQLVTLFATVYGQASEEEENPTRTRGTGTSSRSRTNKSRS